MAKDLISRQSEPLEIEKSSTGSIQQTIANSLDLAANVYGKNLSEAEVQLWMDSLASFSPNDVSQAFVGHIRRSNFFPRPAEIIEPLIYERQKQIEQISRQQYRLRHQQEREENDRRVAAGEVPIGWPQVLEMWMKKISEIEIQKNQKIKERRLELKRQSEVIMKNRGKE